jgi:hypothetical protein
MNRKPLFLWLRSLAVPLSVSAAPWILLYALLRNPADGGLDGVYLAAGAMGLLSYVVAAPIAGFLLAILMHIYPLRFWQFFALVLLSGSPALAFQIFFAFSEPGFYGGGNPWFIIVALCLAFGAFAAILYPRARAGIRLALVTGAWLTVISVALILIAAFSLHLL